MSQAKPLAPLEPENLLHQQCGPDVDWSRVNTAESIVGVQTPLSWSFWDEGGELGFRLAYCEMGLLPAEELVIPARVDDQFTALFFGRGATNVSAFRRALDALPFAATDDAEASFFSSRSDAERVAASRERRANASLRLPIAALRLPGRLRRMRERSRRAWEASLAELPHADLARAHHRFAHALPRFSDEVAAQIVASTVATILFGRLQRLLGRARQAGDRERSVRGVWRDGGGSHVGRSLGGRPWPTSPRDLSRAPRLSRTRRRRALESFLARGCGARRGAVRALSRASRREEPRASGGRACGGSGAGRRRARGFRLGSRSRGRAAAARARAPLHPAARRREGGLPADLRRRAGGGAADRCAARERRDGSPIPTTSSS